MPRGKPNRLAPLLIGALICGLLLWFRSPLQREVVLWEALRQDSIDPVLADELAEAARDHGAFLERLWRTGKIPHRLCAIRMLRSPVEAPPTLAAPVPEWVLEAAVDADLSVRELALTALTFRKHPAAPRLLAAALQDADPDVRLVGLQKLRSPNYRDLVAHAVPLLNDQDLRVRVSADATLRAWTGLDFGTRMSQLAGHWDASTEQLQPPTPEDTAVIGRAIDKWKQWWAEHASEYPPAAPMDPQRPGLSTATDFTLNDLSGQRVRLRELRGRPVLLNFWATWCSACWEEFPDLIELQKRHGKDLVVLGIALDGQEETDERSRSGAAAAETPHAISERVRDFVKLKGINYTVLLDPRSRAGAAYYGHELPANVLIDPEGRVRRRFMGGRPLAAYEAMLAELTPASVRPAAP